MPTLTAAQAEEAMGKIIAILEDETTKAKILAVVAEVNALPAEQQQMAKMMKLMPAVQEVTAPVLEEYGFQKGHAMMFMMQMQQYAATVPAVKEGVAKLQAAMAGNV